MTSPRLGQCSGMCPERRLGSECKRRSGTTTRFSTRRLSDRLPSRPGEARAHYALVMETKDHRVAELKRLARAARIELDDSDESATTLQRLVRDVRGARPGPTRAGEGRLALRLPRPVALPRRSDHRKEPAPAMEAARDQEELVLPATSPGWFPQRTPDVLRRPLLRAHPVRGRTRSPGAGETATSSFSCSARPTRLRRLEPSRGGQEHDSRLGEVLARPPSFAELVGLHPTSLTRDTSVRATPRRWLGRIVVYEDKIRWPTRGPNVTRTTGPTMRGGCVGVRNVPAKQPVRRNLSSVVVRSDSACHAGGRGSSPVAPRQ